MTAEQIEYVKTELGLTDDEMEQIIDALEKEMEGRKC